ncbi:hypothetical protein ACFVTX_18240 [Agromyces sp. NPDC058136]|uniref:gp53-like domain-containing protein n=1 Tax=Agromyces sp. NPDC058136 TaxID=3346354 RepID=UPI0036D76F25
MGYVDGAGAEGAPQFNTTPQTVADLNRLRDLVVQRGNRLKGTTAQRNALAGAILVDGLEFYDQTDKRTYVYAAGGWVVRGPAANQANPGAAVAGIDPAAAIDLPNGLIMKTGAFTGGTSVAFGNEYFPVITFATPFPSKCLHVSITPLSGAPVNNATGNPIALDTLDKTQFRALILGSTNTWARAFTWLAVGY